MSLKVSDQSEDLEIPFSSCTDKMYRLSVTHDLFSLNQV